VIDDQNFANLFRQTYRWHLVRAEPARDGAGRVTRWFGTCTDIDVATASVRAKLRERRR
jgi:hypothetical protein